MRPLTRWLSGKPGSFLVLYAVFAAFTTYFCMYAFRKPFSAGTFEGLEWWWGIKLKTVLVISQILGYTLSKYIGIKVCSEMTRGRRAFALVGFIVWAELALVLFAVLPNNFKLVALFLNGIPLGMVWGLVVWYLEGRRTSEALLMGLSLSYILASGVVKDAGRYLMNAFEVSEWWMPAATGLCFLPVYLLSVWLLNQFPEPDDADVEARVEREPMDGRQRLRFLVTFWPGLLMLFIAYFFLTAYRDIRDTFGREIWIELGYDQDPIIFSKAEAIVAFGVITTLAFLFLIKDNRRGLIGAYVVMTSGLVLLTVSNLLREREVIDGFWWMTLVGLGSYLAYVPFGSVLFDRLIATTRVVGTAVFAIYVADAIGYTGSVGILLLRDQIFAGVSWVEFFTGFTYFMSLLGGVLLVASCLYFLRRHARREN